MVCNLQGAEAVCPGITAALPAKTPSSGPRGIFHLGARASNPTSTLTPSNPRNSTSGDGSPEDSPLVARPRAMPAIQGSPAETPLRARPWPAGRGSHSASRLSGGIPRASLPVQQQDGIFGMPQPYPAIPSQVQKGPALGPQQPEGNFSLGQSNALAPNMVHRGPASYSSDPALPLQQQEGTFSMPRPNPATPNVVHKIPAGRSFGPTLPVQQQEGIFNMVESNAPTANVAHMDSASCTSGPALPLQQQQGIFDMPKSYSRTSTLVHQDPAGSSSAPALPIQQQEGIFSMPRSNSLGPDAVQRGPASCSSGHLSANIAHQDLPVSSSPRSCGCGNPGHPASFARDLLTYARGLEPNAVSSNRSISAQPASSCSLHSAPAAGCSWPLSNQPSHARRASHSPLSLDSQAPPSHSAQLDPAARHSLPAYNQLPQAPNGVNGKGSIAPLEHTSTVHSLAARRSLPHSNVVPHAPENGDSKGSIASQEGSLPCCRSHSAPAAHGSSNDPFGPNVWPHADSAGPQEGAAVGSHVRKVLPAHRVHPVHAGCDHALNMQHSASMQCSCSGAMHAPWISAAAAAAAPLSAVTSSPGIPQAEATTCMHVLASIHTSAMQQPPVPPYSVGPGWLPADTAALPACDASMYAADMQTASTCCTAPEQLRHGASAKFLCHPVQMPLGQAFPGRMHLSATEQPGGLQQIADARPAKRQHLSPPVGVKDTANSSAVRPAHATGSRHSTLQCNGVFEASPVRPDSNAAVLDCGWAGLCTDQGPFASERTALPSGKGGTAPAASAAANLNQNVTPGSHQQAGLHPEPSIEQVLEWIQQDLRELEAFLLEQQQLHSEPAPVRHRYPNACRFPCLASLDYSPEMN